MAKVGGVHGARKVRDGTVVSDKMEKTIVVAVNSAIRHPLYKKTIRRARKYMVHDENELAKMGDAVRIAEAAPTSKRKRWQLVEVLTKGDLPDLAPEAIDSTLVEDLVASTAIEPTIAAPKAEAEAEGDIVQESAGPEATETVVASDSSTAEETPDVPPIDEEEVVQASADPGATEEGA